jgi:inward rectifier potassium channel
MTAPEHHPPDAEERKPRDLGFGTALGRSEQRRLMNRDGSFTSRRVGLGIFDSIAVYHYLLNITWPRFFGWVAMGFLGLNALFALAFVAAGPDALQGAIAAGGWRRLLDAFFFSVDTLATIGYGNVAPVTVTANLLVTLEALLGLLGAAVVAGVGFARISRPHAGLVFSEVAVVAPYHGGTALMLRTANARRTELVQVQARVNLALNRNGGRQFHSLKLERDDVVFLPTTWTVVHPIDEDSPIHGLSAEEFQAGRPELYVLMTATEEDFSEVVHARTSYAGDEFVWGARFVNVLEQDDDGRPAKADIGRLSEIQHTPLPVASGAPA